MDQHAKPIVSAGETQDPTHTKSVYSFEQRASLPAVAITCHMGCVCEREREKERERERERETASSTDRTQHGQQVFPPAKALQNQDSHARIPACAKRCIYEETFIATNTASWYTPQQRLRYAARGHVKELQGHLAHKRQP